MTVDEIKASDAELAVWRAYTDQGMDGMESYFEKQRPKGIKVASTDDDDDGNSSECK